MTRFISLLVACAIALLGAAPSDAVTGPRRVLLMGQVIPSWVLQGASVDMDFANGRYFGGTTANLLSITRASSATDLLPSSPSGYAYHTYGSNVLAISPGVGLLIFEARTNQLLNSATPATQTTGALAATAQTLWVNGSGSATLSNGTATGCAGTATNGAPVTFTPTAGTCTVTVTGSLNAFQLEAGAFGTSFIVTAGAVGARFADVVSATGVLASGLTSTSGSVIVAFNASNITANFSRLFGVDDGSASNNRRVLYVAQSTGVLSNLNSSGGVSSPISPSANAYAAGTPAKAGLSWSAGAGSLVLSNGTVVTGATTLPIGLNVETIGSSQSLQWLNGIVSRFTVFPSKVLDAVLKALTV
jgi:hypothetical protein